MAETGEEGNRVEDDLLVGQGIPVALGEIAAYGRRVGERPGGVLVFLPGEQGIRDATEILHKTNLRHTEMLSLYVRLTPVKQQKIFQPHPRRKIVLSTNVAETLLTVPGIRYVIGNGIVRISRYSYYARVQRLSIKTISQASTNQRKGRCGRIEPGVCACPYSGEDLNAHSAFTDPEILRTSLATVILQVLHPRPDDIEAFPFVELPDGKATKDGFTLLRGPSAINRKGQLTLLGHQLARLPIDPRLGHMLPGATQ